MAREVDATYVNILNTIKNAIDNIVEARKRSQEAMEAAEDAGLVLKATTELIKLRRKEG